MNRETEFIDLLEDYLVAFDGPTPLPGPVRDAIHGALPQTGQVRPVPVVGRMLQMFGSSYALRWAIAAALVVIAVVLGGALLSTGGGTTPAPASPTIDASPSLAAAPSAAGPSAAGPSTPVRLSLAPPTPCYVGAATLDCIAAGTYTLSTSAWPRTIGLTVPAGWFAYQPGQDFEGVLVDSGADAKDGSGWGVMFMTVGQVSKDPCDLTKGTVNLGAPQTTDALIAAMRAWPGFAVSDPAPVVIDGEEGQIVELTSSRTSADCPTTKIWDTATGAAVNAYPLVEPSVAPTYTDQLRIFELDGKLLVIRTTDFPEPSPFERQQGVANDPARHAADQVELHRILDSITFTPRRAQ